MKKILVAFVVVALVAAALWWTRKPAPASAETGTASTGAAGNTPATAAAPLSAENSAAARVGTVAQTPPAPAPEPAVTPPAAPAPSRELRQEFFDNVEHLARVDLLSYREKIRANVTERAAALRAERGGPPTRTVYVEPGVDAWTVALRHVPPGYVGFASPSGYDKEQGGEGFELFLYPEDDDPEWANALLEMHWIEARLPNLPQ